MLTELEDQFIRHARRSKHKRTGRILLVLSAGYKQCDAFAAAGLVLPDQGGSGIAAHSATPRGLDLLATADAIGYDPDASKSAHCECPPNAADDPAAEDWRMYTAEGCATCGKPAPPLVTRECPDCKGRGRVPISELRGRTRTISELLHDEPAEAFVLPGWDVTCTTCKGAKVVPVEYARIDLASEGSGYAGVVFGSRGPDGYLRIHDDEIRINRQAAKSHNFADTSLIWHDFNAAAKAYHVHYCETGRTSAAKTQPGEWIDFTCLADVEGWEGATIEVRHRDGEHHSPCTLRSASRITDDYYRVYTSARSYSSHTGWQFRKLASAALPLPGGSIGYAATAAPSTFSFHAAWSEAKARPDYHKPDWDRAQRHHEHECRDLPTWLKIVRDAPGRADIRDADRPDSPPKDEQTSKWLHVPAGWTVDAIKAAARFDLPRRSAVPEKDQT